VYCVAFTRRYNITTLLHHYTYSLPNPPPYNLPLLPTTHYTLPCSHLYFSLVILLILLCYQLLPDSLLLLLLNLTTCLYPPPTKLRSKREFGFAIVLPLTPSVLDLQNTSFFTLALSLDRQNCSGSARNFPTQLVPPSYPPPNSLLHCPRCTLFTPAAHRPHQKTTNILRLQYYLRYTLARHLPKQALGQRICFLHFSSSFLCCQTSVESLAQLPLALTRSWKAPHSCGDLTKVLADVEKSVGWTFPRPRTILNNSSNLQANQPPEVFRSAYLY
jgi:hypothetical protein